MMNIKINKLFENIISLVSLKGTEYILGFILLPYLVRVLGVDKFGAIAFMQGIVQYCIILVDYGFNLTGPRDIAKEKSTSQIAFIFSNIMGAKLLLFILICCLSRMFIMLLSYMNIYFNERLYWVVFLLALGNLIFPVWFFQGIQQMRYITIVNVMARSITVLLVFLFVKGPSDYLLAALFQSTTLILAGLFSYFIIIKNFNYILVRPTISGIMKTFKTGWHIFLSTIAINLYTTTNIVLLGFFTNETVVGYFSTANKLIDSVKGIMFTINQAVYPYASQKLKNNKKEFWPFIKKYAKVYIGSTSAGSLMLVIFAPWIILLLFGDEYKNSIVILQILSISLPIISISNIFGIQILLNCGYQKAFSNTLIAAAILDLILILIVVPLLQGMGVAVVMVCIEAFVTISIIFYIIKIALLKNLIEK